MKWLSSNTQEISFLFDGTWPHNGSLPDFYFIFNEGPHDMTSPRSHALIEQNIFFPSQQKEDHMN